MYLIYKLYFSLINNLIIVLFLFRFSENNMHTVFSIKRKIIVFTLASLYSIVPLSRFDLIISNVFFLLTLYYLSDFNLKQSIIILIKFEILLHIASAIICFLHSLLFSDAQLLYDNVIYQDYKSILVEIIAYVVYCLYCNLFKSNTIKNMYLLLFNITILGICLLLSYITLYICYSLPKSYMLSAIFAIIFVLIIICISLYDKFLAVIEENTNYRFKLELNKMEQVYSAKLDDKLKQLHSLRHDMKNHLLALKKYSQEQDWIGLNDYLNELSEDILDYNYQIWTGNRMLDMILNEKLKEAKDKKIDMQISTEVFTTLPFTDREIISLFGNLLDNAIEACERITDKNTWIHIKMKKKNQLLYFEIKNTTEHTVQPVPGKFISTKTNGTLHGYGMKNIMDVVEKYRGIFQSQMVEDYFVVMISVYADIYSK